MQSAINQAGVGTTVYICPGSYNGTITIDKDLTLVGAGSSTDPGATVLDANIDPDPDARGRTLTIGFGFNLTLQGIRITGGYWSGDGAGIYNDGGILTVTDCVVTMNTAIGSDAIDRGGGIFNDNDGTVVLTRCSVLSNSAADQGGGIFTNLGTITLNDSSVTGNDASEGGGIYNDVGQVTLASSSVTGNTASIAANNCGGTGTYDGDGCAP